MDNNRVVANAGGTVVQKSHYYPFGMAFAESTDLEKQPYKYNGKELDHMHRLNMYDYSARQMEPSTGRFMSVDPHSENYYSWSPYVYVGNNPILNIDPTGEDYWSTNDPDEIKRFLEGAQSNYHTSLNTFDFQSWTHVSDDEFVGNLTFNDETNTFHSSYVTTAANSESSNGYEYVNNGISIKGFQNIYGKASFPELLMPRPSGGRIDGLGIYSPEFIIISGAVGASTGVIKNLWNILNASQVDNNVSLNSIGFRGGKQRSRDASLNRYPKDFAKWYHREIKGKSRGDASAQELAEWYSEWVKMGKPIPK